VEEEEEEEDDDDDDEKGIRSCIVAKKRIAAEFFCFSLYSFFVSLEYYLAVTTKLHWHRDLELRRRHGRKRSERVYEFE
jgi:hypothetical protein